MTDLNLGISFAAGLFSFFSPCVLPLVPAYLASMGAQLEHNAEKETALRGRTVVMASSFVFGFTLIFIIMGVSVGFLGSFFLEYREVLNRAGGIIVFLFGLKQLGVMRIPFIEGSFSVFSRAPSAGNLFGAFLMGTIFSLGWSPCVGPVLAGILLLGMGAGNPYSAAFYLFTYSLGLAVPFLLIALFWDSVRGRIKKLNRFLPLFTRMSAVLLMILGILLFSGLFPKLASILV